MPPDSTIFCNQAQPSPSVLPHKPAPNPTLSTSLTMSTGHKLPLRGSRDAPHFDGTPTHLQRYFADIEQLHKFHRITYVDEDLIVRAIYYLDAETAELWEGRLIQGMQWRGFKAELGGLYPRWDGECLYSIRDLENIVQNYAESGIFNRITLGQYYRDFEEISKHLAKHRRVNDQEQDRLFLQGFGETTCKHIEARIVITNQQHHPDDPYPMAEVQKAAKWLLASTTTTGAVLEVIQEFLLQFLGRQAMDQGTLELHKETRLGIPTSVLLIPMTISRSGSGLEPPDYPESLKRHSYNNTA